MDEKFIGIRIAELRKQKKMSARALSLELNQSKDYINRIETNKMLPSVQGLFSICKMFNITLADFFKDDNDKGELEKLLSNADNETKEIIVSILKKINNTNPKME